MSTVLYYSCLRRSKSCASIYSRTIHYNRASFEQKPREMHFCNEFATSLYRFTQRPNIVQSSVYCIHVNFNLYRNTTVWDIIGWRRLSSIYTCDHTQAVLRRRSCRLTIEIHSHAYAFFFLQFFLVSRLSCKLRHMFTYVMTTDVEVCSSNATLKKYPKNNV